MKEILFVFLWWRDLGGGGGGWWVERYLLLRTADTPLTSPPACLSLGQAVQE